MFAPGALAIVKSRCRPSPHPAPIRRCRPPDPRGTAGSGSRQNRRLRAELLLRRAAGPRGHPRQDPPEPGDGAHRAVRLRQVDVPALAQPDERHRARRPRRGGGHHRRPATSTRRRSTSSICGGASAWCSRSRTRSRSRSSTTSPTACASTGWRARARSCGGRVEASLKSAALWDEVKDRLQTSALALSGGQQQRLCIARALAVEPEILLMDEPASALDPIATQRIEELIYQLKSRYTIVIVTHNMQQAARVSDVTAFFWLGKLVECGRTEQDFHGAVREADRGLRHGEVRLMALVGTASSGIFRRSSSSSRRACSRWAGSPRSRSGSRSRAWSIATAI